ncbi:hypothetical protein [Sphingomonas sp. HMP9]|uniref:hypothetical protein n=1 Tax=Sphingomonas sp. HMP9 TaxID=1517554 RepID=UPI001E4511F1|nr:hypothetical protein [Sphingomonas sp. HMP9]
MTGNDTGLVPISFKMNQVVSERNWLAEVLARAEQRHWRVETVFENTLSQRFCRQPGGEKNYYAPMPLRLAMAAALAT